MYRRTISLLACVALSACGANTLRLESAQAVSDASSAMISDASTALALAADQRQSALATLIASDVSCVPYAEVQTYRRARNWRHTDRPAPLCVDDGATGRRLAYRGFEPDNKKLNLRPLPQAALKPTLLMLSAIGDYGAALSKIVARPNADISKELASVAAKADAAGSLAKALGASGVPDFSTALSTDQAKSAIELAQFASELAEEAAKVRDVRELVRQNNGKISDLIPKLKLQLGQWLDIVGRGNSQAIVLRLEAAYQHERYKMSFDQRLIFVKQVMAARAEVDDWNGQQHTIDSALDDIQAAETTLVRRLDGQFNAEEQRRIAAINADRIVNGLNLVAKVIVSFAGAGL